MCIYIYMYVLAVSSTSHKQDPSVLHAFKKQGQMVLQGHESRNRYNLCLGLLCARLMYW